MSRACTSSEIMIWLWYITQFQCHDTISICFRLRHWVFSPVLLSGSLFAISIQVEIEHNNKLAFVFAPDLIWGLDCFGWVPRFYLALLLALQEYDLLASQEMGRTGPLFAILLPILYSSFLQFFDGKFHSLDNSWRFHVLLNCIFGS